MDNQCHAIFAESRDGTLTRMSDLYVSMGFVLNDTDVLVYGQYGGYVLFTITDYVQACELVALDIFND